MSIESKHAYRFGYLKSEQWQNVRIEALAREGGRCQICGEESIHNDAHHIWYPENIYDTISDQLVIMCRPCHEFVHVMMPKCKTRDHEEGMRQWMTFKNAIIVWRRTKISLFTTYEGMKMPHSKLLRDELERVKALLISHNITDPIRPKKHSN